MNQVVSTETMAWPRIRTAGYDGFLVSFADHLSEPANRAALAFRAAVERAGWSGVEETSTSLVSTYLRFDPNCQAHDQMQAAINALLATHDWFAADLPDGRKLWRVPTVFGTNLAPQLEEAAQAAGLTVDQAIASISQSQVRVQTIGFPPACLILVNCLPNGISRVKQRLRRKCLQQGFAWLFANWFCFPWPRQQGGVKWGKLRSVCFARIRINPLFCGPAMKCCLNPQAPKNLRPCKKMPMAVLRAR